MKEGDEAVYTMSVPGLTDAVKQFAAAKVLTNNGVSVSTHQIAGSTLTVKRLYTRWRGDGPEQVWQQTVKDELKALGLSALIDVVPWSHAAGYPIDTTPQETTK